MTDPRPTAAIDDVVDLVRLQCDASFGNLVGELTPFSAAAEFVASLEDRGVSLTLADPDAEASSTHDPVVPEARHSVVIHLHLATNPS
ncbi:hypothetical protein [Cellulosimicrobium sp. TH-20]|uniref:hypothetical protein n=1 Tax=Cellulosimicrobium sp. TH-20 TaxID=1980001 RepID=UPI001581F62A